MVFRRPRLALLCALLAAFLLDADTPPSPGLAGPLRIATRLIPLDRFTPQRATVGRLDWLGGVEISSHDRRFGGWSGLDADPDGRFTAISDRGYWWRGQILADGADRVTGAQPGWLGPIPGPDGAPLSGLTADCEEVRAVGDHLLLAFERDHRLWLYARGPRGEPVPPVTVIPPPARFATLKPNVGPEAVARLRDGRLFVISESMNRRSVQLAWLSTSAGDWQFRRYRPAPYYAATAAAALPDGRIFIVERRFALETFTTRLVMLPVGAIESGDVIDGIELARLEAPLTGENFEGLSVWTDARGRPVITVISDNNYFLLQRTLLMRFRCRTPDCA